MVPAYVTAQNLERRSGVVWRSIRTKLQVFQGLLWTFIPNLKVAEIEELLVNFT